MKNIQALFTLYFFWALTTTLSAQSTLNFQVDLNGEKSVDEVGLRGNIPPLSWNESLPMTDEDGDGIYTLSLEFPTAQAGDILEYKFLKDGIWERQDIDNRKVKLNGQTQILPKSKWQLYSDEFVQNKFIRSSFGKHIFIFSSGKKRGKTPKEITQEMIEFYNWQPSDWPSKPKDLLGNFQMNQTGNPGGYFEVLEDDPQKIKFIMGRYWRKWFDLFGANLGIDQNGLIQGVSKDDVDTYFTSWLEHYCQRNNNNWKLKIEEQGEEKWIVTISSE